MTPIRAGRVAAAVWTLASAAHAEDAVLALRTLAPETALAAAQAALAKCRASGWQVAVAVVDRGGVPQVLLRDRFAGPHTPQMATGKAWTALSFRTETAALARLSQPGAPESGIRHLPGVIAVGGGVPIEAQGSLLGGIGVSGAPGADADGACAHAGIEAIRERIEF